MTRLLGVMLLLAALGAASAVTDGASEPASVGSELPYPPASRPQPDEIFHASTGLAMSFQGMMDMVSGARLVFIGESHDNFRAHQVQLEIIRDLDRRFPGRVAIGMEMFRQPQQEFLDRWVAGELTELEFLEAVDWHRNWGTGFRNYRDILRFARDRRIDVIALNPSRELQEAVRKDGLDGLPDEMRSHLPDVGPPDRYQHAVMQAVYGGHLPTEGAFESFFDVQRLWEESMAERVVSYLRSPRGEGKIMVTLTGSGHVEYGFGVPAKVLRRMALPYTIVLPTEIEVPPEKQMPGVEYPELPLLPGDFLWWIPYQDLDVDKVRLGVVVEELAGELVVREVAAESAAERAGMLVGDVLVSLDGQPLTSTMRLVYWVGQQTRGSSATVTIRRGEAPMELRVEF